MKNERWFNKKKVMADASVEDSGVQVNYKSGRSEAVENYGVLALFETYYNKWFVA